MTWRQEKRFIYGIIFTIIIFSVLAILFLIIKPGPSCRDQKQNQEEEGIDCGGPCLSCEVFQLNPLKIYPAKSLVYSDGTMDLIAEVENSNSNFGVADFDYKFTITGAGGEIREATGKSFILALQRKYILSANREKPEFEIASVSLTIDFSYENWQKAQDEESLKEIKIDLLNYEFVKDLTDSKIKSIKAEIINSGNVDYRDITLKFVVLGSENAESGTTTFSAENQVLSIIGIAQSEIAQLEPMARQTLNITLPPLLGTPEKVIFEPESNIF